VSRSDVAFGQDSDMFFEFFGEIAALESDTWGAIKTLIRRVFRWEDLFGS